MKLISTSSRVIYLACPGQEVTPFSNLSDLGQVTAPKSQ